MLPTKLPPHLIVLWNNCHLGLMQSACWSSLNRRVIKIAGDRSIENLITDALLCREVLCCSTARLGTRRQNGREVCTHTEKTTMMWAGDTTTKRWRHGRFPQKPMRFFLYNKFIAHKKYSYCYKEITIILLKCITIWYIIVKSYVFVEK